MRYDNTSVKNKRALAVKAVSIGVFIGALFCTLLLLAFSFMFVNMQSIPYIAINQIVIAISAISSFLGGLVCVKISKNKGMAFGSLTGLALFLIILAVSIIVLNETITSLTLLRLAIMVLAGAIGGVIGINQKKRRRK